MTKQESVSEQDTKNRTFKLTIVGFDSGLNEVLNGVHYDYRTKRIVNPVKKANDDLMIQQIRFSKELRGITLNPPIELHYAFFCKDKRRDRMNVASAFDKSFEDSLQKCGKLQNDSWDMVLNATFEFDIDKTHPRVEVAIHEISPVDPYDFKST